MRGGLSVGIALVFLLSWPTSRVGAQDEGSAQGTGAESEAGTEPEAEPETDTEPETEAERRAQVHFESGRNHYEAGAYEAAIREFEAAYELSPRPVLLYNLYLTHERAGDLEKAADALRRYLDEGDFDAERRRNMRERLSNLERRLEERRAAEAEQAQDEGPEDDGRAAPPPPPRDAGGGVPTSAVVSFVAGGVGLATFAVFAGLSESEDQSVANDCGVDAGKICSGGDVSKLRAYNIIADVALGVGLAAAATGVILWLVDDGGEAEAGDVALAPWLAPERAGAAAEVRF